LLFLIAILIVGFFWVNRPQLVTINSALPSGFPKTAFSHQIFESLLKQYVDTAGRIDYDEWYRSPGAVAELDSYLAAVSAYSPDNAPQRFPTSADALAYWMYSYNAYVIRTVLDNWPIKSINDVKAPLEAVRGLGFFYRLRYNFGGQPYNLYDIENKKIREQYQDPRIHFVLNCASESCPVVRPELPVGQDLETLLAQATVDFVNNPANVGIDHRMQVVHLSAIFKWYEKDFVNELRSKGRGTENGLIGYLAMVADPALRADLERVDGYTIEFHEFDWRVNANQP
jgi:hypothetical protein